jgi:DNA primase small subunit
MGPDQELLMAWFHHYYKVQPPRPPSRLERREFGFMFFDRNFVQRHIGFISPGEMQSFLISQVPSHVYHSTAYYRFPNASTMDEKQWEGADLIFDLDADHVKGAEGLTYEDMLARIKVELLRLIDDFLLGDLGLDASNLKIVFSGGRGYHIHVSDARISQLKSHERREIVDYVSGTDLNMDWVFLERVSAAKSFQGRTQESRVRSVPPPSAGGWRKRMRTGVEWLMEDLRGRDIPDLRTRYPSLAAAPDGVIDGMLRDLYDRSHGTEGARLTLDNNVLGYFSDRRHLDLFLMLMDNEVRPRFTSDIDEPVTSDIKRLIRLPLSLHGKTGLRVVPMSRDELDRFEPLRDAVPDIYPDTVTEVFVKGRQEGTLRGQRFDLEGRCEVPLYLAIFLVARRAATLELPPG